jgi:hypothetical protein
MTKPGSASLEEVEDAPLVDMRTGTRLTLGSLWEDKPVVLVFLRRLG